MECERCGNTELYITNGLCEQCQEDDRRIDELRKQGHSFHCACRIVMGDGECECELQKGGYDPYAWFKHALNKNKNLTDEQKQQIIDSIPK